MEYLNNSSTEILTVADVAEELGIGKSRAYELVSTGQIKAFRIGKIWKISRESLVQYIRESSGMTK